MKEILNNNSFTQKRDHDLKQNEIKNWYAVYTRSRCEKVVAKQLEERQYEHFLPLVPKLRHWKDRKKVVKMPIFPGYVFVYLNLSDRLGVLQANGVVRLVGFNGKPSVIPEDQIENVRKMLEYPERVETAPYFTTGECIEITMGPLSGLRGKIIQIRGKQRLLVCIDIIRQAISVEVDAAWLKHAKTADNLVETNSRYRCVA